MEIVQRIEAERSTRELSQADPRVRMGTQILYRYIYIYIGFCCLFSKHKNKAENNICVLYIILYYIISYYIIFIIYYIIYYIHIILY